MKAARVLAAGLALAGSASVVSANINPTVNDVLALNYALQLEHLESAFYTKGLAQFPNASDFPAGVRDYLMLIAAHEQAHVNFLTNALTVNASAPCTTYKFTNTNFASVAEFLATAIVLEDTGVSAYTAALNHISVAGTQQAAATIATIEARHAAFLRNAVGVASSTPSANTKVPFPEATNTPLLPQQVLDAAGSFFVNCPYNLAANLPTVRPTGVAIVGATATAPISAPASATASSATPTDPRPTYTQAQLTADIDVLQYALTLEYLEADFYQTFADRFTTTDYNGVATVAAVSGQAANVRANVQLVRDHEVGHVQALQGLIRSRGAYPRTAGCYNWSSIADAQTFLTVAALLENTGVQAYDGAANGITDTGLQQVAASVAVVEARHAAYLNNLLGKNATNQEFADGAYDQTRTPAQIVDTVSRLAPYVAGASALFNCTNNAANTGSSGSFVPFVPASAGGSSSSSTGPAGTTASSSSGRPSGTTSSSTGAPSGGGETPGSASLAAPAIVSAALAFVAALLF